MLEMFKAVEFTPPSAILQVKRSYLFLGRFF